MSTSHNPLIGGVFDGVQIIVKPAGTVIQGPNGETETVTDQAVVFDGPRAYCTQAVWDRIVDHLKGPQE